MAGQIKESEKVSTNFLRNTVMFYILRVSRSVYFTFFSLYFVIYLRIIRVFQYASFPRSQLPQSFCTSSLIQMKIIGFK